MKYLNLYKTIFLIKSNIFSSLLASNNLRFEFHDTNRTVSSHIFIISSPIWFISQIDFIKNSFSISFCTSSFKICLWNELNDFNISTFKCGDSSHVFAICICLNRFRNIFNVATLTTEFTFGTKVSFCSTSFNIHLFTTVKVNNILELIITFGTLELEMPIIIFVQMDVCYVFQCCAYMHF